MNPPLFVKNSILIKASPEKIWDALTNPSQTKKYMFGCETVSDWHPGSDLFWRGEYEGKQMVFVKGKIVEIVPHQFLSYTTIDPNSDIPDVPANYLTVTYELQPGDAGQTGLTVSQGDYSKVADGAKRFRDTLEGGGWQPILEQIKKIVEAS